MRLQAGAEAPPIPMTDLSGEPIDVASERPLWLGLFRYAACPFCSMRVHELISRQAEIEASGVDLVVVFPSPPKRIAKYVQRFNPSFRLASDPEESVFRAFGAEASWMAEVRMLGRVPTVMKALTKFPNNPLVTSGTFNRLPSEYLIRDGVVLDAFYGRALDDGPDIDMMLAKVAQAA